MRSANGFGHSWIRGPGDDNLPVSRRAPAATAQRRRPYRCQAPQADRHPRPGWTKTAAPCWAVGSSRRSCSPWPAPARTVTKLASTCSPSTGARFPASLNCRAWRPGSSNGARQSKRCRTRLTKAASEGLNRVIELEARKVYDFGDSHHLTPAPPPDEAADTSSLPKREDPGKGGADGDCGA